MPKFSYTPDKDLKVHEEGAIRLLCQSFRSHENGLPDENGALKGFIRQMHVEKQAVFVAQD